MEISKETEQGVTARLKTLRFLKKPNGKKRKEIKPRCLEELHYQEKNVYNLIIF